MNKIQQRLLDKIAEARKYRLTSIPVAGARECSAARQLVQAGLAKEFRDCSVLAEPSRYINAFTRKPSFTKTTMIYGGSLHFEVAA